MSSRTALALFLVLISSFAHAQISLEQYRANEKHRAEQAKKYDEELRTNLPKIQVALFENDQEVPPARYSVQFFDGHKELMPTAIESGIFTFNRDCTRQQLLITLGKRVLYFHDLDVDLFNTGALIVVHRVSNLALLQVERNLPTPLLANEQYEKFCLFHASRFNLREFWLSAPTRVRSTKGEVTSLAIAPHMSGCGSYRITYHIQ